MKVLTLWNPWAALVAMSAKQVETRTWKTKHRGPIGIHAAKGGPPFKSLGTPRWRREFRDQASNVGLPPEHWPVQPSGCILATAELVDVREIDNYLRGDLSPQERIFGNYEDGRYAWFLQNITKLREPVYIPGNRLLWEWDEYGL